MVGAGGKLLMLSVAVVGLGLVTRHVLAQEAIRSDRVIDQSVEVINEGSPYQWEFFVTYKNNTNKPIIATVIMQAKHCEDYSIAFADKIIILEPNKEKSVSFPFMFSSNDVIGCQNINVEFFVWESLATPKPLAKKKTVTINF